MACMLSHATPNTKIMIQKNISYGVESSFGNTEEYNFHDQLSRINKMAGTKSVLLVLIAAVCGVSMADPQLSAMFVFGDSLIDPGNNNYLNSLAKANYVPYGVDFYQGPSGRFCNGRTLIDYLGDLLGLPLLPPYTDPFATGKNILRGVNFASAAGGILEETGQNLGERFSLSEQVHNFEDVLNQLRSQMDDDRGLSNYLANALVILIHGSNDYINNYLLPFSTRSGYSPNDYADMLITRYTTHIMALHSLGLRKFFIGGIGPLGCIPNQLATGLAPRGKCVALTNEVVQMFNVRLVSLVDQLNSNYNGSVYSYGNTFGAFHDILNNSKAYGFSVIDRGCCGVGRNQGQITCLPFSVPCANRNQYVFWDAFHPTQAVNQILARRAYSGPTSDCYPVNIQQMARIELVPINESLEGRQLKLISSRTYYSAGFGGDDIQPHPV